MIRLILDNFGGSHKDMFIIIDSSPWQIKVVDSYFLFDFFGINHEELRSLNIKDDKILNYKASLLLNYWLKLIKGVETGRQKFIPFDLSDQYIGGLLLEKVKNNFKVKYVWTDAIQGYHVGKSTLDKQLVGIEFKEDNAAQWLISEEGIYNGIDWSLRQLVSSI